MKIPFDAGSKGIVVSQGEDESITVKPKSDIDKSASNKQKQPYIGRRSEGGTGVSADFSFKKNISIGERYDGQGEIIGYQIILRGYGD